ncbi:MAG: UDP-3-O-acyl-N-acetylglucosamine deacetylase [Acidobacteriota bacterium]
MNKILVVDDEKNIQVSLASILEDEGYKVFFASTGEEGFEKYQNLKPDIIFLDIWLPGIDGLETMRKILEIDPVQVVVMISGHGNIATAVQAVKEGAYDFLEKPLSLDKVMLTVRKGLNYKKVLDENRRLKSILSENMDDEDIKKNIVRESTGVTEFKFEDNKYSKKQKTVGKSNIFYGIGLHSGEKTGMSISPLPAGKGIRFENISAHGYIPARVEYLDTTDYATSISKDGVVAKTIEHFMATLYAFGITNLSIKINKEVPIDDGSATKFCDFIRASGIVEQDELIPEIVIDDPLIIGKEGEESKFIKIEPSDEFSINYTAIYPEPLGRLSYEFTMTSAEDFEREIAPSRTYGFVNEFNKLSQMGLAEGGRLNNFILIDDGRVLNTELRFDNEIVRHKILDIIGDFYLLGRPLRGKIVAQKTGHSDNAKLVNLIKEKYLDK